MIKLLNLRIVPERIANEDQLKLYIELGENEKVYNCVELIYKSEAISMFDLVFDRAREIIKNAIIAENPIKRKLIAGINSTKN